MLNSITQDIRFALRQMRLAPGFTSVAILSLALGIGANLAMFQLIDALRMRAGRAATTLLDDLKPYVSIPIENSS